MRAEVKKLYDGLHVGESRLHNTLTFNITHVNLEFLDLRAHVWGIREFPFFVPYSEILQLEIYRKRSP